MSDDSSTPLQRLIDRPLPDLRREVRKGSIVPHAELVEAVRGEAVRFYHTDTAMARRIARRALDLGQLAADPLSLGWGLRAMAEALLFSGRMRRAEAFYEKAAKAWRDAEASGLLGQLLVGRTYLLAMLGDFGRAQAAATEARRNLEAAGDHPYLAKLAMQLGNVHVQRDQYGPALEEYDQAAQIFARLQIRDETVLGLEINRGVALSQLDRDEEALALFTDLETECRKLGYELLLAQTRMNAAYVHSQRADFGLALHDLGSATDYFRETEHPSYLAACYLNRAEIYQQLNLHREALELTEKAIPLFEREGMSYDRALAVSQAALSHLALGELSDAIREIRKGRALFVREKNRPRVAWMALLWAEALSRRSRVPPGAERRAREALEAFRDLRLVRWEAAAAVLLSRLEAGKIAPAAQIPRLRKLLRRIPERIYPIPAYRLLEALGDAQQQTGMVRAAVKTYGRALERLEDLRVRIPTEDSKIAFLQDKAHLYHRLLSLELATPKPSLERLFEWMERSRAQALYDQLRDPSSYLGTGSEGDRPALLPGDGRLADLRRRLSWLHTRLSRLELGSPAELARAKKLQAELSETEEAWTRALRERAEVRRREERGRAALLGGKGERPEAPSPDQIAGALPEGWGFLSYHVGPDFALAVVITREGGIWRRLTPDLGRRLVRLADRLDFQWGAAAMAGASRRQGTGGRGSERALHAATDSILEELFELLWRPIEEIGLPRRLRWIVAPHGPIHRVPLHAMRDASGYLAERTDLTSTPSGRVWMELPKATGSGRRTAWVGGVPSARLPAVVEEVERVCRHLDGWRVTKDLDPTGGRFRTEAVRAHLLHLAAHGQLRRDNPAYSYLELSDGPLFVHDLGGLRLPGSTVVLSACSSGRGAAPVGDEWIGLARGFLQAGAATVVASLWPVHEEPTLELMDHFYARLSAGSSAPEALAEAMRSLIPRRPHPWEWASFGVLGGV